jgi:hypothetical protein
MSNDCGDELYWYLYMNIPFFWDEAMCRVV